jgi:hypothetical protein
VSACGVRKVWSRVFEGCDTPSKQIKKLKEILTELGMPGRPSMDQAKKIKEQRELAKELGLFCYVRHPCNPSLISFVALYLSGRPVV